MKRSWSPALTGNKLAPEVNGNPTDPTNKEPDPVQPNPQVVPPKTVLVPETHLHWRSPLDVRLVQKSPTRFSSTSNCWIPGICWPCYIRYWDTGMIQIRPLPCLCSNSLFTFESDQLYDQFIKIFISMCTFFISRISNCFFFKYTLFKKILCSFLRFQSSFQLFKHFKQSYSFPVLFIFVYYCLFL